MSNIDAKKVAIEKIIQTEAPLDKWITYPEFFAPLKERIVEEVGGSVWYVMSVIKAMEEEGKLEIRTGIDGEPEYYIFSNK